MNCLVEYIPRGYTQFEIVDINTPIAGIDYFPYYSFIPVTNIREENGKKICDIDKAKLSLSQRILIDTNIESSRLNECTVF